MTTQSTFKRQPQVTLASLALTLVLIVPMGMAVSGCGDDETSGGYCGDGTCGTDEDACTCADDCLATCGDGCCSGGETIATCPLDCGSANCGNGTCDSDEDTCICPSDCGELCGDGCCNGTEDRNSCPEDCDATCGDSICDGDETACTCPGDCPDVCGDGCCTGTEDEISCAADCGTTLCTDPSDCDDSDACTTDTCGTDGFCANDPVDPDDGDACTADSCDPVTGVANDPVDPDDGDACTADSCDPVTGVANDPIDPDDGDACTLDSCDPVTGVANDPVDPDDSDACTLDSCDPATGVANDPIDPDDGDACTVDSCDPVMGVANDPIDPDDGNFCTVDTCDPAVGVINTPIDPNDSDLCTLDTCDPAVGVQNLPSVTIFSEGFADNSQGWTIDVPWEIGPATAGGGGGFGGPDPDTDVTSTADNGVAGVVLGGNYPTALGGPYYLTSPSFDTTVSQGQVVLSFWRWHNSDYDPYIGDTIEVFDGAGWVVLWSMQPNPPIQDAPPFGPGWTYITFDITAYVSTTTQIRFGHAVTNSGVFDSSGWNIDDVHVFNAPFGGDDDLCTDDVCDSATGQSYSPTAALDDGNPCTVGQCDPLRSISWTPVNPDDGNACTTDSCDPTIGIINTPIDPDDNNACTTDSCDPSTGVSNTPIVCNDGDPCTADSCDPTSGCQTTPIPQPHDKCVTGTALISGCADQCITNICAVDSFCCATSWDGICVGEVQTVCGTGECAGGCAHPLCDTGVALTAGCDASTCVTDVCAADPFCCATNWDGLCVGALNAVCGLTCP